MTNALRLIAGCMTGTSLDGLDAALVEVSGRGTGLSARFRGMTSASLGTLRAELRHFAIGRPAEPVRFARAARALGQIHADALLRLCEKHLARRADGTFPLDLVVAHGQTIWHAPPQSRGGDAGVSWQLMDPWPIVRALHAPVVYDLRQADLIAGGQGAPITPASDWVLFRSASRDRLIVNLGGICNVTRLPANAPLHATTGGDIGPCNLLLDGFVQQINPDLAYDADGALARTGRIIPGFADLARRESPFFSRPIPRTTGREDFDAAWLARVRAGAMALALHGNERPGPVDLLASAVDFVAQNIAQFAAACAPGAEVVVAGGGARNGFLVERLAAHATLESPGSRVLLSDALGIPVEAREAVGFAVLGALCQDGVPITLPAVTGAAAPGVAGAWAGLRGPMENATFSG